MVSKYKDLLFWKKAFEVTLLVVNLSRKLPKDKISYIRIDQIIRSSASIGANIAEGFGRYKGKEYVRFLQIALGSANETDYWLSVLQEIYPEFKAAIQTIMEKNLETIKMLSKTLNTLNNKGNTIETRK